jgi:hypothetical protein
MLVELVNWNLILTLTLILIFVWTVSERVGEDGRETEGFM